MKKILAFILSLSLILTCISGLSLVVSAATLNGVELEGEGTDASPYLIDSAEKFQAVFGSENQDIATTFGTSSSDLGPTYLLTDDITLDSTYKPAVAAFYGKLWGALDGEESHKITITSVLANAATDYYAPSTIQYMGSLIHDVEYGEIKNLEVCGTANIATTGNGYYGVVAGQARQSTIKNVINKVDVTGAQKNGTAGIVGATNTATIKNCVNYGNITANNQYTAGIAGDTYKTAVENCINEGAVSGTKYSAGIVGNLKADSPNKIENCINKGTVEATAGRAGGIAGISKLMTVDGIKDCKNYGAVKATEHAAGIVAEQSTNAFSIRGCENYGQLNSTSSRIGGIVGYVSISGTISECANFADLYSDVIYMQVAGILAVTSDNGITVNIEKCYNKGNITTAGTTNDTRGFSAGIVGWVRAKDTINVTDCYNLGEIKGYYKGAVAGQLNTGATVNVTNFYDLTNTGIKIIASGTAASTVNAYTNNNLDGIQSLINNSVWFNQDGYDYPSLATNPYIHNLTGSGTEASPYRVYTFEELKLMEENPSAFYKQIIDINNADEVLFADEAFSGTFDGNGKSITLAIDDSANTAYPKHVGLFGLLSGTVKNVTTKGFVNAGFVNSSIPAEDSPTGETIPIGGAAAIVGVARTEGAVVENCKNYADVTSTGYQTAGIVGTNDTNKLIVKGCYNYGDITAAMNASGIIGVMAAPSEVQNCGNYGNITGGTYAAGICSWVYSYKWLENSFNVGTITATAEGGKAIGLYGNVIVASNVKNIQSVYNAGALTGDYTYGIAEISEIGEKAITVLLKNSYNAVNADYPIANKVENTNITYTIEGNYYLADESQADDNLNGTEALNTKEALMAIAPARFSVISGSAYKYPQLTSYPLDSAYADIDFSLVTVDNKAENTYSKFYTVDGEDVKLTVKVADKDFYEAYVNGEKVVDDKAFVTVNGDTLITVTVNEIEYTVPEDLGQPTRSFTSDEGGAITLRDKEYTRYSLVFSKAAPVVGLKLTEFGLFFAEDENVSVDNYKHKAVAESERISENGAFGILLYTDEGSTGLLGGTSYYVLPYAVYTDKDGNEFTVTGAKHTFMFND